MHPTKLSACSVAKGSDQNSSGSVVMKTFTFSTPLQELLQQISIKLATKNKYRRRKNICVD
jgi:hypothetical protein